MMENKRLLASNLSGKVYGANRNHTYRNGILIMLYFQLKSVKTCYFLWGVNTIVHLVLVFFLINALSSSYS